MVYSRAEWRQAELNGIATPADSTHWPRKLAFLTPSLFTLQYRRQPALRKGGHPRIFVGMPLLPRGVLFSGAVSVASHTRCDRIAVMVEAVACTLKC